MEAQNKQLLKKWLFLGILALALSGLFAVFLVIGRSPSVNRILPHVDFFQLSLTIHVNLSVFIWLTCAAIFVGDIKKSKLNIISEIGFWFALIGTILVSLTIFDSGAKAYLNNYIPMAGSDFLKVGLAVFTIGIFLASLSILITREICFSNRVAPLIIIISCFSVISSYLQLEIDNVKSLYNPQDYYELLFWAGGHILQFTFVQLMIMAWFKILPEEVEKRQVTRKVLLLCSIVNLVVVLYAMIKPHGGEIPITSYDHISFYTMHMKYFGGISAIIAALYLFPIFFRGYKNSFVNAIYSRNSIVWSFILFMSGGFISLFIDGVNTIIPAHYHGSIVGVSLGAMGYVYILMNRLGYKIVNIKMASIQPIFYGAGQLIHIIGLAISGGYGALRKTPGMMESFEGKFYMGLMGLGGLISIIGGLLFVIVIVNSVLKK